MSRRLILGAVYAMVVAILTAGHTAAGTSPSPPPQNPVLQRFLTLDNSGPRQVTTIRHLEARNEHFDRDAWMDVRTEADPSGFRFRVLAEGGSAYIRSRVFNVALQSEQKLWADGASERATFTTDNYLFEDRGQEPGGLAWLGVTPRREDLLLVNGSIFLRPADGDLVRIEGTLSKTPSFWTRKVDIVRHYRRIAGVRLPVALESTADVRIAGISTFSMTFTYETVNGRPIP